MFWKTPSKKEAKDIIAFGHSDISLVSEETHGMPSLDPSDFIKGSFLTMD